MLIMMMKNIMLIGIPIETAYDNGVDLMVNIATDIETANFQ